MKSNIIINSSNLWLRGFPWKKKKDHKYSRGKVIIFGSQLNMVGSTILSAEAALRVGTGSVKIVCSKKNLPIYTLKFPSVLKEEINSLMSIAKELIKQHKKLDIEIKRLTKTRLNDRTSSSWKSLKELKKKKLQLKDKIIKLS